MTGTIAGAEYVQAISARESDRDARDAFQQLALRLLPSGGRIFDFGSGPGIDARFFCDRGYTVLAYDVDPQMNQYFEVFCQDLITRGRAHLLRGDYRQFLAERSVPPLGRAQLITSNFAPLCLLDPLPPLFARLFSLSAPSCLLLASVLNPFCYGDLRYAWWWRNIARLWFSGYYAVQGAQAPVVRRTLATFAKQCTPYFRLERVYRGLPSRNQREAEGYDASQAAPGGWLHMMDSQFIFLLFKRCDDEPQRQV